MVEEILGPRHFLYFRLKIIMLGQCLVQFNVLHYTTTTTTTTSPPSLARRDRCSIVYCNVLLAPISPLLFGETLEVIQLNWSVMNIQFKLHQTKHNLQLLSGPAVTRNINKHCILSVC